MSRFRAKRHFSSKATAAAPPVPVPKTRAGVGRATGSAARRRGLRCRSRRPVPRPVEADRLRHLGEDRHSGAKCEGLDVEPVLVDQAVADEGAGESGTSVGDDVAAGRGLDALDFVDQVAARDARLRPPSRPEGLREDDLRNVVHRRGVVAVGSGPVGCHVLVCDAPHEMGVRAPHRLQFPLLDSVVLPLPSQGCEPSGRATKPSIEMPICKTRLVMPRLLVFGIR